MLLGVVVGVVGVRADDEVKVKDDEVKVKDDEVKVKDDEVKVNVASFVL